MIVQALHLQFRTLLLLVGFQHIGVDGQALGVNRNHEKMARIAQDNQQQARDPLNSADQATEDPSHDVEQKASHLSLADTTVYRFLILPSSFSVRSARTEL